MSYELILALHGLAIVGIVVGIKLIERRMWK